MLLPLIFPIRLQDDGVDVTEQGDQGSIEYSEFTELFASAPGLEHSTVGWQPDQGLRTTADATGLSEEEQNAREELTATISKIAKHFNAACFAKGEFFYNEGDKSSAAVRSRILDSATTVITEIGGSLASYTIPIFELKPLLTGKTLDSMGRKRLYKEVSMSALFLLYFWPGKLHQALRSQGVLRGKMRDTSRDIIKKGTPSPLQAKARAIQKEGKASIIWSRG